MFKKNILFSIALFLFLAVLFFIFISKTEENGQPKVCFDKHCFNVEIADSQNERVEGLMNRETLSENSGMLFVFDRLDFHSFWMKNTLIPLDIIWIGKEGEVVFIKKDFKPCKTENCPIVTSDKKALYALEVNAGMVDKIDLKIGDRADIDI